jgi:hypothetical protein
VVVVGVLDGGHDRDARGDGDPAGLVLAPHPLDDVGGRADEGHGRLRARAGERRVLRQEPVAGVDRLRARAPRRVEHRLDREVRLGRRRGAEAQRRVGRADVWRAAVGVGVDGDRPEPERPRGAQDPQRDLAAVGDQHRGEHHMRKTP